jgi:AcrR family transcriptional regulator
MQPSLRRTIIVHTRLTCPGENMLELKHSIGVRDVTIAVFSDAFSRHGSEKAGISHLLEEAGASKSALREQLKAREDLVSAFLKDRHAIWMRWFENEIEARSEATGGGLEIIADVLQKGFEDPKSFGLAFVNIVTQNGDFDEEPAPIAREQKEHLRRFIEQLAAKMGIQHPERAGSTAVLVIEQTIARTLMAGSLTEAQTARLLFQCLQHA